MKTKEEKTSDRVAKTMPTEHKEKSKVQLFMEEMQKNPLIRIVDMRAVLR